MPELRHVVERQKATARVLLVADESLRRGAIAEALDGAGLSITGVTSAEAALSATEVDPEPPAAILVTDTDLPGAGMDGLALAGKARRRWPNLGVVFVTARPSRLDGHVLGARDRFLPIVLKNLPLKSLW